MMGEGGQKMCSVFSVLCSDRKRRGPRFANSLIFLTPTPTPTPTQPKGDE